MTSQQPASEAAQALRRIVDHLGPRLTDDEAVQLAAHILNTTPGRPSPETRTVLVPPATATDLPTAA